MRWGMKSQRQEPESLQTSVSLPAPGEQYTSQYETFGDQLQGTDIQQSKSAMDATSTSLGFGLEHTLETMIGDQFVLGTDVIDDDLEWDTFFQQERNAVAVKCSGVSSPVCSRKPGITT